MCASATSSDTPHARDAVGVMNLCREWERVRIASGVIACNRYSWLRPIDPRQIDYRFPGLLGLVRVSPSAIGEDRTRALRIDEAQGVLDVQFAIADVHEFDRRSPALRFRYEPRQRVMGRRATDRSVDLAVTRSQQHFGVRHWWSCPGCDRRCRFLYHFEVGWGWTSSDAVGCRECLALTYASRSRHRCADGDRVAAIRGNAEAAARVMRRAERRRMRSELALDAHGLRGRRAGQSLERVIRFDGARLGDD